MDDHSKTTRLIDKPDGSQSLLLRQARLTVIKGPDRGAELKVKQPRVRVGTGEECELQLSDPAVSRRHLELRALEEGYLLRDLGSTNGTSLGDALVREAVLTRPVTLRVGGTTLRVLPGEETVEIPLSQRGRFGRLLGQSTAMRGVFAVLERMAGSGTTLLIEGESGTGKELAAEAVHEGSARASRPFVVVDCAAMPGNLIESELFGHERGAFTGADQQRVGALEEAHGGTLFLDEVGELPLDLQPRLLRFLETQQVKRLGSARHLAVDVRVIAATNRSLAHEVKQGRFREDLFYRLSVVCVELPPLRERTEDILLLAHHFAERYVRDPRALFNREIIAMLTAYHWPGNARELRNVVERLALVPEQALANLREGFRSRPAPGQSGIGALAEAPFHEARSQWQERFEKQYLTIQLERAGGVVAQAAKLAELPRPTFHRLLKRHGLREG
jgi:transcriptional regulator with GAF, ATPase, and Fis domain